MEIILTKYHTNPNHCNCCKKPLEYDKRKNKYCSNSCATKVNNLIERKRGPTAKEKLPFSKISWMLCKHTNQWFSNRNSDGTIRRTSPYIKTDKEKYYSAARFRFNVYNYPEEFDLSMIETHGWYTCPGKKRKNGIKNIDGVSRDHLISVSYGFENDINPKIIAHPANCRIMLHSKNKLKHTSCAITLDELLVRIRIWDEKYTEQATGFEPATNSLEG